LEGVEEKAADGLRELKGRSFQASFKLKGVRLFLGRVLIVDVEDIAIEGVP
jgi:hypothetical protein